jgi:hypothetical protein
MTFPRISSLILALGGSVWACLLLGYTCGFLRFSAGAGFFWLLIWLPGFFAWYAYIRHVFGHFLFRRARITWLISVVANSWSLFFVGSFCRWQLSTELPLILLLALAWIIVALVLSVACAIREWRVREPERHIAPQVAEEDFRRLLDEHRRKNG